jgi:hypothetical protein
MIREPAQATALNATGRSGARYWLTAKSMKLRTRIDR